jgi:hypothetical protein
MWNLYASIAIGGVLLMVTPPKELSDHDSVALRVAFVLTWPMYLIVDVAQEYRRRRFKRR